jgi:hypothetical protein
MDLGFAEIDGQDGMLKIWAQIVTGVKEPLGGKLLSRSVECILKRRAACLVQTYVNYGFTIRHWQNRGNFSDPRKLSTAGSHERDFGTKDAAYSGLATVHTGKRHCDLGSSRSRGPLQIDRRRIHYSHLPGRAIPRYYPDQPNPNRATTVKQNSCGIAFGKKGFNHMYVSRTIVPLWQKLFAICNNLVARSDVEDHISEGIPIDSLSVTMKHLSRSSGSRSDLWANFVNHIQAGTLLEIGVWKGAFASCILSRCASVKRYYMIDPWRNLDDWNKPCNRMDTEFEKCFREAMEATQFAELKRVVLRGTTTEVIGRIPDGNLDFVYIDGDHTLRGIAIDLISAYAKVRMGGFVAGDDLVPNIWQHGRNFEPTLVFPFAAYFAEAVGMPFFALPHRQFLIAKLPRAHAYEFIDFTGKYGTLALRQQLLPS